MRSFAANGAREITLERSVRCPEPILRVAQSVVDFDAQPAAGDGKVVFWRCANDRAQAQSVAADIERLTAREGVAPGQIVVLVPAISREGQAVAVALEERAVPHRVVGEAAFFQRAEIRDVLAWLRLLADPSDAAAVVRALARPPIDLRSVDIARCTQIARRRKLDMVAALAAAIESPQVPPEARERIRSFLKLYRAGTAAIDTTRPDLYVHRLIDRLGLRRQQLFAAQADVVERLRALARLGELAAAFVRRSPQATPREFARSIAAVADFGLREQEEPEPSGAREVQVVTFESAGAVEADHVYVLGLHAGLVPHESPAVPDALLQEKLPPDDEENRRLAQRQTLYVAMTRARSRLVLAYPRESDRGALLLPSPLLERALGVAAGKWEDQGEELFGPAETLHSTYRLLRDELLESTLRVGGRLGELRFDTDLDVSHAVVRYLELLKLAGLIARPEGQSVAEGLARRQRADPPGGNRRAARDLQLVDARRVPAGCRARRAAPGAGARRPGRAVARVVPAQARRRRDAVGVGHRHLPDLPTQVQVRTGLPHPAGADDPPALRDPRASGARALPRAGRDRRNAAGAAWACSRSAGDAAGSATPRRSASFGARRRRP